MGKIVGVAGSISGKIGSMVFSKGEGGVSYAKAYQPVVSNPRTNLQCIQRAKMNLTGQISSLVPARLLTLGQNSSRRNRSAFNKQLLGLISVDNSTPGSFLAQVDPEAIMFSRGAEILHAVASTPVVSANEIEMTLTLNDNDMAGKYGERVIVLITSAKDKAGIAAVAYSDIVLTSTTAANVTVRLPFDLEDDDMVTISRSPFVLSDEGAAVYAARIYNTPTEVVAELQKSTNMFRGWGDTRPAVKVVFPQA